MARDGFLRFFLRFASYILLIFRGRIRRVFVEQFGHRNGRITPPHGLRQLHDIAVRHMGGLEAGHAVDAVRMV